MHRLPENHDAVQTSASGLPLLFNPNELHIIPPLRCIVCIRQAQGGGFCIDISIPFAQMGFSKVPLFAGNIPRKVKGDLLNGIDRSSPLYATPSLSLSDLITLATSFSWRRSGLSVILSNPVISTWFLHEIMAHPPPSVNQLVAPLTLL